jgi:hypothetical protein
MWKYVKLVLGVLMLFLGGFNLFFVASGGFEKSWKESSSRLRDNAVPTTGVITGRYQHTTAARVGRIGGIGQHYSIKYSFETRDGKKYGGEVDVTKEQATTLNDGAPIRIKYDSANPSINSALEFERDHSNISKNEPMPVAPMLAVMMGLLLGGGWLTWSSWQRIREDAEGSTPYNANVHARLPMNEPRGSFASANSSRGGFGRR